MGQHNPVPWTRDELRMCGLGADQAHMVRKAAERAGYALQVLNNGHHWQFKHPEGLIEWWPSRGKYVVNKLWGQGERANAQQMAALLEKWGRKVPAGGVSKAEAHKQP